jgi:hypothetical protein
VNATVPLGDHLVLSNDVVVGVLAAATGQPHTVARVKPDEPITDRAPQHDRGEAVALSDSGRRQSRAQLGHPLLNRQVIDLGQRVVPHRATTWLRMIDASRAAVVMSSFRAVSHRAA